MANIRINQFDIGVKTYGDLLDSTKFTNIENLETDKPGMAYRRDAQKIIANDTFDIKSPVKKWVHDDLNNDAEWIMYGDAGGNDLIKRYRGKLATSTTIKDFGATPATEETCKIIPFDREIRFANGLTRKAGLYQYIDRDYFWNSAIKTVDAFDYDDAEVRNSALSFSLVVTDETSTGGTLDLSANTYYYKVVAVFDNGQECPMPERFYSTASSAADSTVIFTIAVDFSSWNERITQFKIYRSDGAYGTYKLVNTVDCRDTTSDENVTYTADANVGWGMHVPSQGWTDYTGKLAIIGGYSNTIASNTSDVLTFDALVPEDGTAYDDIWAIVDSNVFNASCGSQCDVDSYGDWTVDNCSMSRSNVGAYRGSYRGQISISTSATASAKFIMTVLSGQTYYIHAALRIVTGDVIEGQLQVSSNGSSWTSIGSQITASGSWEVKYGTFLTSSTLLHLRILCTNGVSPDFVYFDSIYVGQLLDSGVELGSCGRDIVISGTEFDFDTDSHQNGRILVGTAANGNNDTSAQRRKVTNNIGRAVQVDSVFTGSYLGTGLKAYLSRRYLWQKSNTSEATLYFYDQGESTTRHYLEGKTKVTTNYKYGVFINGRMYGLYVRLDPDGEAEDWKDLVIFSEFDKPDVMPIGNAIRIQDLQGGIITGGANMNGDLVIFANKGVYVLRLSSIDPKGWALINPLENIGCIAPDSIEVAEGVQFFAGKDNVHALTSSYIPHNLADDILDQYQGSTNLENSEFKYDPVKQRLLCKFGDTVGTTWCLDLKKWFANGSTSWTKITTSGNYQITRLAIDEDMLMHSIYVNGGSFYANNLYDVAGGAETFVPVLKDGDLPVDIKCLRKSHWNG
jgi:hypothetical protein